MTEFKTNPHLRIAQKQNMVRREVLAVRRDWPLAKVFWGPNHESAVLMVHDANATYVIEVLEPVDTSGAKVRSLWVSHRVPIGPYSTHIPAWEAGWVD